MIYINNKKIHVNDWSLTILQQCEQLNISIPRFCYHDQLSIAGNCRMCVVEVKTILKPVIACATSLTDGMHIFTNSELVKIARENVLEFLLVNHPLDCPICDQGGECDLQDQSKVYGTDMGRFTEIKRSVTDLNLGPVIKTIMTRCIHCTRCVRYAEEITGTDVLGTIGRGRETELGTYFSEFFINEVSGNVTDICPVGALTIKPYAFRARRWELTSNKSIDIFDSLGSWINLHTKGYEIFRILPIRNDLINGPWITDKVRFSYEGLKVSRMKSPIIRRNSKRSSSVYQGCVSCSWDLAQETFTDQFFKYYNTDANRIEFILGEMLSAETISTFLIFSNFMGLSNYYMIGNPKQADLRRRWLYNTSVKELCEKDSLFFLNSHLKLECAVLNAHIHKSYYEFSESKSHYYIGCHVSRNIPVQHVGISQQSIYEILQGKHFLNKKIQNQLNSCIVYGDNDAISEFNVTDMIKQYTSTCSSVLSSYVVKDTSTVTALELGISLKSNSITDVQSEGKFIYMCGVSSNSNDFYVHSKDYRVYSCSHLEEIYADLYLPMLAIYEYNATYYNGILVRSKSKCVAGVDSPVLSPDQLLTIIFFDWILGTMGFNSVELKRLYQFICLHNNNLYNTNDHDHVVQSIENCYRPLHFFEMWNNTYESKNRLYNSWGLDKFYRTPFLMKYSTTLSKSYQMLTTNCRVDD